MYGILSNKVIETVEKIVFERARKFMLGIHKDDIDRDIMHIGDYLKSGRIAAYTINDDHYRTGNNLICNLYADRIRIIILRIRCCRANSFMGKYAEQLSFFRSYLTVLVEMGIPVSCIRTLYCKYQLVW